MKIIGIILIIVGLVLAGGAAGSGYGLVAPVTMLVIPLIGILLILKGKLSRKSVYGLFVAWLGLVLTAGSAAGDYGIAAPITMSLVIVIGIVLFILGMKKKGAPSVPGMQPPAKP